MKADADADCGIKAGRLTESEYEFNFQDHPPRMTRAQAAVEAERCLYCFEAPCQTACPTGIDIPAFIQRIAQNNIRGSAKAILEPNPLGGMCARVCPTEVLCEQACVRNTSGSRPVEIGALHRYATDLYFERPGKPLFERAAETGKRIAVVGAGPAGLACAHGLAHRGHRVVLFDAHHKPGGLNEYGLAAYKTTDNFAQAEVRWLLSIGGIEIRLGQTLGKDFSLEDLTKAYDAVFLGLGLAAVNALSIGEGELAAVRNAVDFIAELRQASNPALVPIGRRVVVIGGGMTSIDAAVQSRLLGAEQVTIVYRRGPKEMSASIEELRWAQVNGVSIRYWARPADLLTHHDELIGIRFLRTGLQAGRRVETDEAFTLEADMVLSAIGQSYLSDPVGKTLATRGGRILTGDTGRTSRPRVWAGGDCRYGGRDLTVEAVEHGKRAAIDIHTVLASPISDAAAAMESQNG